MALWLLALKAFLVCISVCNGAEASSEPVHIGSIFLLPTNAEAPTQPLTDPVAAPVEPLADNVEETTFGPAPTDAVEELVSTNIEGVTDKISTISDEPEEVNPDLESSHDLLTESKDADLHKDISSNEDSEIDHEVEILDRKDSVSSGKTLMPENIFEPDVEEIAEFVSDGEGDAPSWRPVRIQQSLFVHREKVFSGKVCSFTRDEERGDIVVDADLDDSSCTGFAWTVNVGDGFSADVTLKSLNINEVNGEFLIIGPGSSLENLWQDEANPLFTAVISKERKFRILESTDFTVFLVTNSPDGFRGGFSLSYERAVKVETTPVPTTPAPTLPTPGANITTVITVFLGGKTPKQVAAMLEPFQTVVAHMANKYALENEIVLTEEATSENVVVSLVTQCDVSWPETNTCVRSNISVALITPNDDPNEFELTADHLQDMWDTMAATNSELAALGLYVYVPPNALGATLLWVGISVGVLIVFLVFLLVVWRVEVIRDYARMTSKQETMSNRDSTTSRASEWFPGSSQHQLVPPFMDVYSDVGYVEYEPEFNGPVPIPKYKTSTIVAPIPTYEPPPKYGPPAGYGGAVRFYGNKMRPFDNDAFEEDEEHESKEEEINTSQIKYQLSGILKNPHDNDNSTC